MALFLSDKIVIKALRDRLRAVVVPKLHELEFVPTSARKVGFPLKWVRDRPDAIDMMEFQWKDLGRPEFVINFRRFDHPDDIAVVRADPAHADPGSFALRAYMKPSPFGWFRPSLRARFPRWLPGAVEGVAQIAAQRVGELADFLDGGPPTAFLQDSFLWLDKRLPDNPPPWDSLPVGSAYHLPSRRVGIGEELWGK